MRLSIVLSVCFFPCVVVRLKHELVVAVKHHVDQVTNEDSQWQDEEVSPVLAGKNCDGDEQYQYSKVADVSIFCEHFLLVNNYNFIISQSFKEW